MTPISRSRHFYTLNISEDRKGFSAEWQIGRSRSADTLCRPVDRPLVLLPRDAMRKRGLCCGPVSVRPSVCLSVCLSRSCILSRRLKISSNFFIGPVAPSFSLFVLRRGYPIPRGTSSAGAQNTRGGEILRFSTEIAVCLGNRTRSAHGCYRTLIGSYMRSIEW